jgi:spore germination protein YaaH
VPSKKLIAAVVVVAAVVVGGGTAAAVGAAVAANARPTVTGYADAATTREQVAASSDTLTTVAIDGVTLTRNGTTITAPSSANLRLLADAHSRGKRGELLVSNFDDAIDDFSPAIAAELLDSPATIDSVVTAITAEVQKHSWDGVTVDLESLDRSQAAGLTAFVRALDTALGANRSIAVALQATTGDYGSLGYQLKSLDKYTDRFVLMAYDQHGPWSGPGPVGGTPWVAKALTPLLHKISPSRIDLGIAGYGYSWPGDGGTATSVSDAQAREAVATDGAKATWSTTQGEWRATLADGTRLWWSDKRTFSARYALARHLHLHGVAVWSLSQSDPLKP